MKISESGTAVGIGAWSYKAGSIVLGWVLSFLAPVQPFLIMLAGLVFCDLITGIWSAQKTAEPITAKRLADTLPKVIFYPMAIVLSQKMVTTFFTEVPVVESLTYMVSLFICSIELKSNFENIGKITGINIWAATRSFFADRLNIKKGDAGN